MRPTDVCLGPTLTLDKVSDHITKHNLTGTPVIDEDENLLGFVSEYDCLKELVQSAYYCDNTSMAEDVMTKTNLTTVRPDMSLMDLASEMNKNTINVVPVMENDKVIGVISRGDVVREMVLDLDICLLPGA